MVASDLQVGEIVVAKHEIIEDACGDHPDLLLASQGQRLVVKELFSPERRFGVFDLSVFREGELKGGFYCKLSEIRRA